jgi:hypothetical protein
VSLSAVRYTSHMRMLTLFAGAAIAMTACRGPEPAPAGLDEVMQFLWLRFNTNDGDDRAVQDVELRDAIVRLDEAVGDLAEPQKGTLDDPTPDMAARVGLVRDDLNTQLQLSQGMYIANVTACTMEDNEDISLSTNGNELRPTTYEAYSKAHDEDPAAFDNEERDTQQWRTSYTVRPVGDAYTAEIVGRARRVRDEGEFPFGNVLITQVVLPEVATFESPGDNKQFTIDMQMEAYWEKDGAVKHVYGMWRRMVLPLANSQDDIFIDTQLDGMLDWETDTDKLCRGETDVLPRYDYTE